MVFLIEQCSLFLGLDNATFIHGCWYQADGCSCKFTSNPVNCTGITAARTAARAGCFVKEGKPPAEQAGAAEQAPLNPVLEQDEQSSPLAMPVLASS